MSRSRFASRPRFFSFLLAIAAVPASVLPVSADVVRLKNGQTMTGKVVEQEGPQVRVEMKNGASQIDRSDIDWIVLGTEEEIQKARRAAHHYGQAQDLFRRRRYEQAVDEYKQALVFAPEDANILNNLGCAYANLGRWTEALAAFSTALKKKRSNSAIALNLAQAYIRTKEYRRAERELRKLVTITRDNPDAYLLLGVVFYHIGRYTKSIDAYQKALKLAEPGARIAEIHNNLGSSYLALSRYDEARTAYDEALRLNPNLASAQYNREKLDKMEGKVADPSQ